MLYKFAREMATLVHQLHALDSVSVKLAEESCAEVQAAAATGAFGIYEVMQKQASITYPMAAPMHTKVTTLTSKMAEVLGKAPLDPVTSLKIASVVHVDNALSESLAAGPSVVDGAKLAELRSYGREYFAALLHEVL